MDTYPCCFMATDPDMFLRDSIGWDSTIATDGRARYSQ